MVAVSETLLTYFMRTTAFSWINMSAGFCRSIPMPEAELSTKYALEFFQVANAVVGFYVLQTLLFMNAIYQHPTLQGAIVRRRGTAIIGTGLAALLYVAVIAGCAVLERQSLAGATDAVLTTSTFAAIGRALVVVFMAGGCMGLLLLVDNKR
jgi:hypothetical protein